MTALISWPGVVFRGLVTSARVPVDILIILTQPHNKSYYSYYYQCCFHHIKGRESVGCGERSQWLWKLTSFQMFVSQLHSCRSSCLHSDSTATGITAATFATHANIHRIIQYFGGSIWSFHYSSDVGAAGLKLLCVDVQRFGHCCHIFVYFLCTVLGKSSVSSVSPLSSLLLIKSLSNPKQQ